MLVFEKVTFASGGKTLFGPADIRIADTESVAIMGPNGAGKSLFLELAHGLLPASSGSVQWNKKSPQSTRKSRGYIFQKPTLLRRSVKANLKFALSAIDVTGSAAEVRLNEVLNETGLNDFSDMPAAYLSGGEAQRLALGRALIIKPNALLMDEPTSSLDPETQTAFEDILERLKKQGCQLIWITHDRQQAARLADQIIYIQDGKILEKTASKTFFKKPNTSEAQRFLTK